MKLKDWLLPREERFFDLFEAQANIVVEGVQALEAMLAGRTIDEATRKAIKEIEHKGDKQTHELFTALNASFITPIDREDIAALATELDDILDFTWATANGLVVYGITEPPPALAEIATILQKQAIAVRAAVGRLRSIETAGDIESFLVEINHLENQADEATYQAVARLFELDDVKKIIKLKEIFEHLETATDKAEDVAHTIRSILIKHK